MAWGDSGKGRTLFRSQFFQLTALIVLVFEFTRTLFMVNHNVVFY